MLNYNTKLRLLGGYFTIIYLHNNVVCAELLPIVMTVITIAFDCDFRGPPENRLYCTDA